MNSCYALVVRGAARTSRHSGALVALDADWRRRPPLLAHLSGYRATDRWRWRASRSRARRRSQTEPPAVGLLDVEQQLRHCCAFAGAHAAHCRPGARSPRVLVLVLIFSRQSASIGVHVARGRRAAHYTRSREWPTPVRWQRRRRAAWGQR